MLFFFKGLQTILNVFSAFVAQFGYFGRAVFRNQKEHLPPKQGVARSNYVVHHFDDVCKRNSRRGHFFVFKNQ